MNPNALLPFGRALLAYDEGENDAGLIIRREDGSEATLPVHFFFRSEEEFSDIELRAMDLCRGHVLDIGAGTGIHSKALKARDMEVTALDITPEAADIMCRRGIGEVVKEDIFKYQGGPFDTLIMLGHGIGIVEDLQGLQRFLAHAGGLLFSGGQLIFDSMDVTRSNLPGDVAYHNRNRRAGRYVGEITMQFEFEGTRGPLCRWLHVDQRTLHRCAREEGWDCEIVTENESGEYLARLQKMGH